MKQLIAQKKSLEQRVTHDALTGLFNRPAIFDILHKQILRAKRGGIGIAIIMIDIDHFKAINDKCGHLTGDAVLCEIAERLSKSTRSHEYVGRYGGEEFLAIVTPYDQEGAIHAAERFRNAVACQAINADKQRIPVTISLGVATSNEQESLDENLLLQRADEAPYLAKRKGRNRVELFTSSTKSTKKSIANNKKSNKLSIQSSKNDYTLSMDKYKNICDIMMPVLDGYGMLHMLSKNNETASIPFIFLTAKTERSDLRKGMEMGADDYVTKPFDDIELLRAVESRLKKTDILKTEYSKGVQGVYDFLDEIKNIDDLKKISDGRKTFKYKKKDVIYSEGGYPSGIYLIVKGKVKTYKTNEDGKEFITSLFKEGDFFSYSDLLENTTYTESAAALEDTEVNRTSDQTR